MYKTFSQSYIVVSSQKSRPAVCWYLHDAPRKKTTQKILERYIVDAHYIFAKRVARLADFEKTFTNEDEKHLAAMFELLVDARKIWEEEAR